MRQNWRVLAALFCASLIFAGGLVAGRTGMAQTVAPDAGSSIFRIGEKLTYSVSFGKFPDAGFVELYVVSRGRIAGKDAVEIHSRVKTLDLVSAAFFTLDESRTVFAAPDTGLPMYVRTDKHEGAIPRETVRNYLNQPTTNPDLLTLIYKARETGGTGTFQLTEGDQTYATTFQLVGAERVKTGAGAFDTTMSTVQSEFLTTIGVRDLKINFTVDNDHIPVSFRFKTAKGEFRAVLTAITMPEPPPAATPTPTLTPTPKPTATAKPTPKPSTYIDDQPLAPELGFSLGESLDYRISTGGRPVATINLSAKERRLIQNEDRLLLAATITAVEPGVNPFRLGDSAKVQVDPETLAPRLMESKFSTAIAGLNQTATFDKRTGNISFGGAKVIDAPIGTHTILSLIYAMRSFNLRPSKDPNNKVNDTRVAVFWEAKAYVFTLRPSVIDVITINGEKISAQLVTINTGNPQLDALAPKVWLSNDEGRKPLRFSIGAYQAELIMTPPALVN